MAKLWGSLVFFTILLGLISSIHSTSEFIKNNNIFSINFYNELLKEPKIKGKSIVYSPYSIQTLGALLYAGADGKTASEMINGFKLPTKSTEAKIISEIFNNFAKNHINTNNSLFKIGNKVFVNKGYTAAPKFLDIAKTYFDSNIENVDFAKSAEAAKTVNNWIKEKTGGKIANLIEPDDLDANSRLLLANAIHFKGNWQVEFKKTRTGDFWTTPTETLKVELMLVETKFKYEILPDIGVKIAEYPFKDSDISMVFLLPHEIEKSLDGVEAKLSDLIAKENIFNKFGEPKIGNLVVPKFKTEHFIDMKNVLTNLGMGSLFDDADFKNLLNPSEDIFVSKAVHKAAIEVNEKGAEAVAATVAATKFRDGPFPFYIVQSFLYFIKGNDGEIYFMGRFTGK